MKRIRLCAGVLASFILLTSMSAQAKVVVGPEQLMDKAVEQYAQEQEVIARAAEAFESDSININPDMFSQESIRLNTEALQIAGSIISPEHANECLGMSGTNLGFSFKKFVNPLIPIALTTCETYSWSDSQYTWAPYIYSKPMASAGVDFSNLHVREVNTDTYFALGLGKYVGCGSNCTGGAGTHYHNDGYNDNDSLGPLQILRHYVESPKGLFYPCGGSTYDLMQWEDNVSYYFHKQGAYFTSEEMWNKDYYINNTFELVALSAVAHNTGAAYLTAETEKSSSGSLWNDSESVFKYCADITDEESQAVLWKYVMEWYRNLDTTESFVLAGIQYGNEYDAILEEMGITKTDYASSFGHKQYYPLKAVMNYMSLYLLYTSGDLICEQGNMDGGLSE